VVAAEVADRLAVPLDVFLVRKLGVPAHPELAMGAIAEGGVEVRDEDLISDLGISSAAIEQVSARERAELARRDRLYRASRPKADLRQRTVIVVDDGLATGATMQAAVTALRQLGPARIIVAVPVGAPQTCARLAQIADEVVAVMMPIDLGAVGRWYEDFRQTSDEEVRRLLSGGTAMPPGGSTPL
jgi:predicted phosphoribosyltransferase